MARKYDLSNRMSPGRVVVYVILTLLGLVMFYPMWYVLCVSLSTNTSLAGKGLILWPVDFDLSAY